MPSSTGLVIGQPDMPHNMLDGPLCGDCLRAYAGLFLSVGGAANRVGMAGLMSPGGGSKGEGALILRGIGARLFPKKRACRSLAKGGRLFFFAGTVRGILISRASCNTLCQIGDDSAMT